MFNCPKGESEAGTAINVHCTENMQAKTINLDYNKLLKIYQEIQGKFIHHSYNIFEKTFIQY